MRTRHLSTLFLLALVPAAGAQETTGPQRLPVGGAAQHHRLDLDTGQLSLLSPPPPGAGPECFANNVDLDPDAGPGCGPGNTFADAILVGAGEEVVDWGVKWCGSSGLVESITIGYASQAAPVIGGALTLRIYAGAQGFGSIGTEVFSTSLLSIPSDGPQIPLIPQYLTIELGAQSFFLPNGPIGWGYQNDDGLTAALMMDVGPLNSTQNYLDWYKPGPASAGFLESTFSLGAGGCSNDPFENSTYLVIDENAGTQLASLTSLAGANPAALSAGAPVLGSSWDFDFDLAGLPGTTATQVIVAMDVLVAPILTPFGDVLINPATILSTPSSPGATHSFDLGSDATLLGLTFYAQGATFAGASLTLTNGFAGTIGF